MVRADVCVRTDGGLLHHQSPGRQPQGGSFHQRLCRRKGHPFYTIADLATPTVPIGLGLGRLGNFINGELFGRVTDVPWCMVFEKTGGGPLCRHPSQLYEAFLEGLLLFAVIWIVGRRPRAPGTLFWTLIAGYGACRIFVELFREPDAHLGLLAGLIYLVWRISCVSRKRFPLFHSHSCWEAA